MIISFCITVKSDRTQHGIYTIQNLSVCLLPNLTPIIDLSSNQNQKPFENKFATLAVRAVFEGSFLLQKQLICVFLARNNYPNSPHLQGV